MFCAKFGWIWSYGSEEKSKLCKGLQKDRQTGRRTEKRTDRQTHADQGDQKSLHEPSAKVY